MNLTNRILFVCLAGLSSVAAASQPVLGFAPAKAEIFPMDPLSPQASLRSSSSLFLPSALDASDEGLRCIQYLLKGGKKKVKALFYGSTAATTALGLGTVAGCIATGPTIIGPALIGLLGITGTIVLGSTAFPTAMIRKRHKKIGRILEASYIVSDRVAGKRGAKAKASQRLVEYRNKKIVPEGPEAQMSVHQLAEHLVMMNESGYFCPAKIFDPRGIFLPAWVGRFAKHSGDFGQSARDAKKIAAVPASHEDVVRFRIAVDLQKDYEAKDDAAQAVEMKLQPKPASQARWSAAAASPVKELS